MKPNYPIVLLIMAIFVVISLVTNIMDPMSTEIQASFGLNETQIGYLPFALFLAYLVLSIPSGMLAERFSGKTLLVVAFTLSFLGAFAFAARPTFGMATPAFFLMGAGFAMLQVVTIPLLRVAGGQAHFAFLGSMSQMIFALGSAFSPHLYVHLVHAIKDTGPTRSALIRALDTVVPPGLPWVSLYWVFTAILAAMALFIAFVRLPKAELTEEEKVGSFGTVLELLRRRTVWLYFVGIACYTGTEQGIAFKIKGFLMTCHDVDPDLASKVAVSGFWGAMAAGCAVGLVVLKLVDSRKALSTFAAFGIVTLLVALFTPSAQVAIYALPLMGFWCALGSPVIFFLALNSLEKHHGAFSGILCTAIVGGAFVPPIIGRIADHVGTHGLRYGMLTNVVTLAYVFGIGFWARPLVNNAIIGRKPVAATPKDLHA